MCVYVYVCACVCVHVYVYVCVWRESEAGNSQCAAIGPVFNSYHQSESRSSIYCTTWMSEICVLSNFRARIPELCTGAMVALEQ